MVTEASSALHEMAWRGEITKPRAKTMLERLLKAPVEIRTPDGLIQAAWKVADELGWAKTYDAHYVALAQLLKCRKPALACGLPGMGLIGVLSNHDLQGSLVYLTKKLAAVRTSDEPRRRPAACRRGPHRHGWVLNAVVQVLGDRAEPMRARDIHTAVETLLGELVAWSSVKMALASNVSGSSRRFVRVSRAVRAGIGLVGRAGVPVRDARPRRVS